MSREGVDHALARLRDERDRIASALLDLENHQGYQLLKGTTLTGMTRERWESVQGQVSALWELFDAFRRQLDHAEEIRAQQSRPNQERLAQITRLIAGRSVELSGKQLPLEKRTLLGPSAERLTLDDVVARMTVLYEKATEAVAATDAVWSVLLRSLEEVEDAHRAAAQLGGTLEISDPELERVGRRLAEVHTAVVSDPLSLAVDGGPDTARLDGLARELAPIRARLEDALRLRTEHGERLRRLGASIELVRAAEDEARVARDLVLVKIASPALPDLPDLAPSLTERLAALGSLRDQGRWPELAGALAELERAAETALEQARTIRQTIAGLLERRDELRGRLEAYRAKAGRLGLSEDLELSRLYEHAKLLLWTAPCDLRQATAALAGYQRAITSPADGAGR